MPNVDSKGCKLRTSCIVINHFMAASISFRNRQVDIISFTSPTDMLRGGFHVADDACRDSHSPSTDVGCKRRHNCLWSTASPYWLIMRRASLDFEAENWIPGASLENKWTKHRASLAEMHKSSIFSATVGGICSFEVNNFSHGDSLLCVCTNCRNEGRVDLAICASLSRRRGTNDRTCGDNRATARGCKTRKPFITYR